MINMKAIVIGIGRLGSELVLKLTKEGYEIVAVDSNELAFQRLGDEFSGKRVTGIGFDKEVLEAAGIERVDAVIACTASDEANVVIARIAKDIYQVPKVIARSYDTRKADIYSKLGIQTISTTSMGVEAASRMLTMKEFESVASLGSGSVNLLRFDAPLWVVGHTVLELTRAHEIVVVSIVRDNEAFIPTTGTVIEENDILYFSVVNTAEKRLKNTLGL